MSCEPHPGPHTHSLYASLLHLWVLKQAAIACRLGENLPRPTTVLPSKSYTPLGELQALRCPTPKSVVDLSKGCGRPRSVNGSWRCYEDTPGKLGWVATSRDLSAFVAAPAVLSFSMLAATHPGLLVVGFLRSYAGMNSGTSVVLDNELGYAAKLDGRWSDPTSQADYQVFPLKTLAHPGKKFGSHVHFSRHTISIRFPLINSTSFGGGSLDHDAETGGKFKLLYLATC